MRDAQFEALLLACENALKRFVYYKLPSRSDGDDVLQETLLAAYRSRDSIVCAEKFKPWLLKIAANKCHDFYRQRAKKLEIPLDALAESHLAQSRSGLVVKDPVQETLEQLARRDEQVLRLFFIEALPQADIAQKLGIPVGTVKSRLHTAKQRFKALYPYPPTLKGSVIMKNLPEILPAYTLEKSSQPPFAVKWQEMMGWFIVPRLGEKRSWAMYDNPDRTRSEVYACEVTGRACVHGVEGVEIVTRERNTGNAEHKNADCTRTFVAQLTDTHCRILSQSHFDGELKRFFTFLDADDFLPNWGFGENNCGNEVNLTQKGIIQREGDRIVSKDLPFLLDVVGRYTVTVCGKKHDCVCVMDINTYNPGVVSEQFIDKNGRTVLWRRFNRDDWHLERYKQRWSQKLPDSQRLTVNGELYVHWYDCITDYIL